MARIRTIKPEFWSSPDNGDVSRDARLTFIGLWNVADDAGRLEAVPAQIQATLFPYDDDVTLDQVCGWLNELSRQGLVRLYAAGRRAYLHITGWADHQRIDTPSKPRCPDPEDCRQLDAISPTIQRDLARASTDPLTTPEGITGGSSETLEGDAGTDRRTVGASERGNVGPEEHVSPAGDPDVSEDAFTLTREFAKAVKANGHSIPSKGSEARTKWLVEMDRLLRIGPPGEGGHVPDVAEVRKVIAWCAADKGNGTYPGESVNVRSVPKFRERYSQLRGRALNGKARASPSQIAAPSADDPDPDKLKAAGFRTIGANDG